MFNKIFYFIKRNISRGNCTLKQEKGFSLVEVIVAILIISIVTLILVNGTIMAVNVSKMNRTKTLSSAVASEKLELIKCLDYEDIKNCIGGVDPLVFPELFDDEYIIDYEITWADGVDSYIQVKISVSKEPMGKSVSVITQIYPLEGPEGEGVEYPPPQNLQITGYSGAEATRTVYLAWEAPADTELVIVEYVVYRDGVEIDRTTDTIYQDQIGEVDHTFYVTAIYEGDIESNRSNKVTTGNPPPQNLQIIGYSGAEATRTVHLAWEEPDTELVIVEYVVYRDGVEIDRTTDTIYQDQIGEVNYTFYVTAIYEGDIESDPSNEVTTVIEIEYPPPQNLYIAGYEGGGNNRKVNLAWDAPDTQLVVIEYVVYRGGLEIGRTSNTSYQNKIGKNNYTFYVTAIYEGGIESEPSNEVTTQ